jgi:hypothetical protein
VAEVYVAGCGPHDFAMRATPNLGYRLRLRLRQIRPEESPAIDNPRKTLVGQRLIVVMDKEGRF